MRCDLIGWVQMRGLGDFVIIPLQTRIEQDARTAQVCVYQYVMCV